jgi:hypothetical protein
MKEERKKDHLFSQHSKYMHTFIWKLMGSETKESHISIMLKQKRFSLKWQMFETKDLFKIKKHCD